MRERTFLSLSRSYRKAVGSSFGFARKVPWVFKPFIALIAFIYAPFLLLIALFFSTLIVLDWMGGITDRLRQWIFDVMEAQSFAIRRSFISFLLRPMAVILIAPLFLLSIIIPKFSNSVAVEMAVDDLNGEGLFKSISALFFRTVRRMFAFVSQTYLLLIPPAAAVALLYAGLLMVAGFLFVMLIPIDWLSHVIERIRRAIVLFIEGKQLRLQRSFGTFLLTPAVLIIAAPLILTLLLIPKFSSHFDPA